MEKTIFGIVAAGEIANVAGIFLSVPLLAIARSAFCEFQKMRMLDNSRPDRITEKRTIDAKNIRASILVA